MPCEFCEKAIAAKDADTHGHLTKTGNPEKHKITGQANAYITRYKCSECGARWTYEVDKNDNHAGWSMVPDKAPKA